jgi:hypothetical protein
VKTCLHDQRTGKIESSFSELQVHRLDAYRNFGWLVHGSLRSASHGGIQFSFRKVVKTLMNIDPIIAGALIGIAFAVYLAFHLLKVEETEKRNARKQAEYEERKAAYLKRLHLKYSGNQPHQYRRSHHIDFTGEQPISSVRLIEIKKEILK